MKKKTGNIVKSLFYGGSHSHDQKSSWMCSGAGHDVIFCHKLATITITVTDKGSFSLLQLHKGFTSIVKYLYPVTGPNCDTVYFCCSCRDC